uniref:hypothetical protein n=1 Tax=Enterobacter sp. TaxID=42895 RepID=UPI00296F52B7|nr:hypothetical protein [Enterobacter sp.]
MLRFSDAESIGQIKGYGIILCPAFLKFDDKFNSKRKADEGKRKNHKAIDEKDDNRDFSVDLNEW